MGHLRERSQLHKSTSYSRSCYVHGFSTLHNVAGFRLSASGIRTIEYTIQALTESLLTTQDAWSKLAAVNWGACVSGSDSAAARVTQRKGTVNEKRHGLRFFCHQQSVGRLFISTAIKRSQRCSDILHNSGARITTPPPAPTPASHENVIVTEMGAGTWFSVAAGVFFSPI